MSGQWTIHLIGCIFFNKFITNALVLIPIYYLHKRKIVWCEQQLIFLFAINPHVHAEAALFSTSGPPEENDGEISELQHGGYSEQVCSQLHVLLGLQTQRQQQDFIWWKDLGWKEEDCCQVLLTPECLCFRVKVTHDAKSFGASFDRLWCLMKNCWSMRHVSAPMHKHLINWRCLVVCCHNQSGECTNG